MKKLFLCFLVGISLWSSCSSVKESQEEKEKKETISRAKTLLKEAGEESTKDNYIKKLEEVKNELNALLKKNYDPEAKYLLAQTKLILSLQKFMEILNILATVLITGDTKEIINIINKPTTPLFPYSSHLNSFSYSATSGDIRNDECSNTGLSQTLCSFIREFLLLKEIESVLADLREIQEKLGDKDFSADIPSLPLRVEILVIKYNLDFGGKHDLGDIYLIDSILSGIIGTFKFIFSIDFNINIEKALETTEYFKGVSVTEDPLYHVGKIFVHILKNSPFLFDVNSPEEIQKSRVLIQNMFERLDKFASYKLGLYERNASQEGKVLYVTDEGLHIRYKFNGKEKNLLLIQKSSLGNVQRKSQKIVKNIRDGVQNSNELITLRDDIVPLIGIATASIIKSEIVKPFLDIAISFLSQDMKDQVNRILERLNENLISGAIGGIVGNAFAFNLHDFFENMYNKKTSVRNNILPSWTTMIPEDFSGTITQKYKDNFLIEWDCGAKLYDESITQYKDKRKKLFGIICEVGEGEDDIPHFEIEATKTYINKITPQNSTLKIEKDNKKFITPYIFWNDPTFGYLLYIDINGITKENVCGEVGGQFKRYDDKLKGNCVLNYSLNSIFNNIFSLF